MISSPGCQCLTKGASGPMSTRFWMTSRPGTLRSCLWRSVRLIPGACCTVCLISTSSVNAPSVQGLMTPLSDEDGVLASMRAVHCQSAQGLERRSDLGREQLGLLPGGEVAAPVDLVEVGEGGVRLLDPTARGPEDLAGECGEADRYRDCGSSLAGREGLGSSPLPVLPRRPGPGARQPVQGDIVDDVVPGQVTRRLAVEEGAGDLVVAVGVVVEHPGREGDG